MGLAGEKRKQRIQVDPRNKNWTDDKSKFGFKMLEKMGWQEGKGLGRNEDGQTEHVKVRLKKDSLGIGADKKTVDNWLGNNDAFSALLQSMNDRMSGDAENSKKRKVNEESEENPVEVKIAKVVNHGRLYPNKSPKKILGINPNNFPVIEDIKVVKVESVVEKIQENKEESSNTIDPLFAVTKTTDMNSYFAKRMKFLGIKATGIAQPTQNTNSDDDDNNEFEDRPSFGLGLNGNSSKQPENVENSETLENESIEKKMKRSDDTNKKEQKNKSKTLKLENSEADEQVLDESDKKLKKKKSKSVLQEENDQQQPESTKKDKKKKSKSETLKVIEKELTDDSDIEKSTKYKKKKEIEESNESIKSKKKSDSDKKKSKKDENLDIDEEKSAKKKSKKDENLDIDEEKSAKKKKKSK
ncbi:hypothetical protein HK096_010989 [Nowakowskiella sp. JEL0078]|nr:hypothetical protein HK096_010989 [Nowakowskiella sp. JEL0078]